MYEFKQSPDYSKNYDKFGGHSLGKTPCCVCGRPCSHKEAEKWIRLFYGTTAVTRAEADELIANGEGNADLGYYPIGSACLKNNPELKVYVKDAKENGGA